VLAVEQPRGRHAVGVSGLVQRGAVMGSLLKIASPLDDVVTLLLLIWLFPLAILLVGTPVVLLVRVLIEIVKRL
jgi:hypothetical protein